MENSNCADQLDHRALQLLAARPDVFSRCGHIAGSCRRRNGRTHGPYYRLAYREDGRQRSIYLGREGPLVARVRHELARLQQPRRQAYAWARMVRRIRHAIQVQKKHANDLLRPYGLRLKGVELRGIRFSPFRRMSRLMPKIRAVKPFRFQPPVPPIVRVHRIAAARKNLKGRRFI